VSVYEIPVSLGLPHNVVDPMQQPGNAAVVYPTLSALAHGERPAAPIATR
jgi:hypothetical protein